MTFEEFKKNLRSMNFLSAPAVEYPLVFADALEEFGRKKNSSEPDTIVPFLALTVLLQYSCQGQNVCLNLDRKNLQTHIDRIRESSISACRDKRIFPPEEPDCRTNALEQFDSFWKETLGSDFENVENFIRNLSERFEKKDGSASSANPQDCCREDDLLLRLVRFENGSDSSEKSSDDGGEKTAKSSEKDGNVRKAVPYVVYCDEKQKAYSLYYSRQFAYETVIAECIRTSRGDSGKTDENLMRKISRYLNILFDKNNYQQKTAAFLSCLSKFFIITGGPGTGKTTTVVKLLLLLKCLKINENLNIGMAAPTGKAAARMKESINKSCQEFSAELKNDSMLYRLADELAQRSEGNQVSPEELISSIPSDARTIHRLIGINFSEHTVFNRNNTLPYNVLIVDEASMMDLSLFYKLLQSVSDECQIILLGDQNQLPSVEGGSVFADLCRAFLETSKTELITNEEEHKGADDDRGENGKILNLPKVFKDYILAESELKGSELAEAENWVKNNASFCAVRLTENHRFKDDGESENSIKKMSDWVNCGGMPEGSDIPAAAVSGSLKDFKGFTKRGVYAINLTDSFQKYFNLPENGNVGISNKEAEKWLEAKLSELKGYDLFWKTVKDCCVSHIDLTRDRERADNLFGNFNNFRVLCTNRETVFGVNSVNSIYHGIYRKSSYFDRYAIIKGTDGFEWYPGLPIMITKNNYSLHLYNGDIGITMIDPDSQEGRPELKVLFPVVDDSSEVSYRYFPASVLSDYECAYAITVHKSQGSEMNHVLLLTPSRDSSFITREILYTGITRAKSSVTLIYVPNFFRNQCSRQISRCSNLQSRIKV